MIVINGWQVKENRFPNGELNLDLEWLTQIEESVIEVSWKYESNSDFFILNLVADYLKQFKKETKKVLICWYLPYSRMDRQVGSSVFSLKTVATMINDWGFDSVSIGEPHSDVSLTLISQSKPIDLTHYLYNKYRDKLANIDRPLIPFYPDKGAKARYQVDSKKELMGKKERDFKTGEILSYSIEGKEHLPKEVFDVVILDDLSSYGGTFVRAAKELKKLGAQNIFLIVAHAEDSIFKGELFEFIDVVVTTNSILNQENSFAITTMLNERLVIEKII